MEVGRREPASEAPSSHGADLEASLCHVRSQKYDVFLSYAEEDSEFAEEMRRRLVTHAKLRVFVPSDGETVTRLGLPNEITILTLSKVG